MHAKSVEAGWISLNPISRPECILSSTKDEAQWRDLDSNHASAFSIHAGQIVNTRLHH